MILSTRQLILRANSVFLVAAAASGFANDVRGIFAGHGPVAGLIASAPHAGIGFIEAHGLAFIIGVMLWNAASTRAWHLAAVAIHLLLGISNVVFWDMFVAADVLAVGYVTTIAHGVFALLQFAASAVAPVRAPVATSGAA